MRSQGDQHRAGLRAGRVDVRVAEVDVGGLDVHEPASFFTGHVDRAVHGDGRAFGAAGVQDHIAAHGAARGDDFTRAADVAALGHQEHPPAALLDARGPDDAFVVDGQPVDVSAVGNQLGLHGFDQAAVQHAGAADRLAGRAHGQPRVRRIRQQDALAGCHAYDAVARLQRAVVGHVGGDQKDVSLERPDRAEVLDARPRVAGELQIPALHELGVRNVQGRRDQRAHVDIRVGPEEDAVGIDQEHAPVGFQRAIDRRQIAPRDAIQDRRRAARLVEPGDFVGAHRERGPVDHGAIRELIHRQGVPSLMDGRTTSDDRTVGRYSHRRDVDGQQEIDLQPHHETPYGKTTPGPFGAES